MAFGFSPKYIKTLNLNALDKKHFLVIAAETIFKLGWDISFINETGFIAHTKFSMSSWGEKIEIKIFDKKATIKSECIGNQIFDWGKNKKNFETFLSTFTALQKTLTKEEIEKKLDELQEHYSEENDFADKLPFETKGKASGFFSVFKPIEGYFISPILINLNILIFIIMIISGVHILFPENQSLLDWGANFRPLTLDGQWWRLLTSCFLHIGILHLLLNMYALTYIGFLLEPYLGKTRFFSAYLISGVAASMTSLWWNDLTISAGASGAIFGLYGVFLALLTTNFIDKSAKKNLLTSIAIFIGYNILNGFKPNSGIDNAAHIGGLLSGLIIGYSFIPSLKKSNNFTLKFSTIGALILFLFVFSFPVYKSLPNDIGKYDKMMNEFITMEAIALEVYNLPDETSKEALLYNLKDRGIYYWNESITLIESFKNLDLPLPIRERNIKLKEYCKLRIKSYELIYKAIDEETDKYEREINDYNQQIEKIIYELTGNKQ